MCQVTEVLGFAPSTVWEHLSLLRRSGFSWWGDPHNCTYKGSQAQFVILASELQSAGLPSGARLADMHLHCVGSGALVIRSLHIRLKHTSSPTSTNFKSDGWTEVYSTSGCVPANWHTCSFLDPFTWNGKDNLLVDLSRYDSTKQNNACANMYMQSDPSSRMIAGWGDSVSWPFDSGLTRATVDAIPEIRFGWLPQ